MIQTFFRNQQVDVIGTLCVKTEYCEIGLVIASMAELILSIVLSCIGKHFFSPIIFAIITMVVGFIGFAFAVKRRVKATPVFVICFVLVSLAMTVANIYELVYISNKDPNGGFIVLLVFVFAVWLLKYVFITLICMYNIKLYKFASKRSKVVVDPTDEDPEATGGYVPAAYVPPQEMESQKENENDEKEEEGAGDVPQDVQSGDSAIIL